MHKEIKNKANQLLLPEIIKKYSDGPLDHQKVKILTMLSKMQIKGMKYERYLNYCCKKLGLNNYFQAKSQMEIQSEDIICHQTFKNFSVTEMSQPWPLLYIQNDSLSIEQMSNCICAVVNYQSRKGSIIVVEKMGDNQNIIKGLCEEERFLTLPNMIKSALDSIKYNEFIKIQMKKLALSKFNNIQSTVFNQTIQYVIKIDISLISPLIFPKKVPKFYGISFLIQKPVYTFPKLVRNKGKNSYTIQMLAPEQIYSEICNNFMYVIKLKYT